MTADRQRSQHDQDNEWISNAWPLLIGRVVVAAIGWTATIIIARTLDQTTFGKFTFVFGLLGMMMVVTDMGLGRVAIRGVLPDAVDPEGFAGAYVVLRAALGVVGYFVALAVTLLLDYPSDVVRATALAGLVVVISTVSHAHEIVLQARLKLQIVAVAAVIGRLGQLALIVAIALRGGGLILFVVPAIVAEIIITAVKVPMVRRLLALRYNLRPHQWGVMLREALPLSVGFALATIAFRIDVIMLSRLDDFVAVGIYEIAFKFADVLHFVSISISAPVLTVLVKAWPDNPDLVRLTVERVGAFLALLGGGLVAYFTVFAGPTIELLYGASFLPASGAARLLVVGEVLGLFSVLGLTLLTALDRHRPYPLIALAGLTLNVIVNFWAIPRWSFDGAAVVTVATEALILGCIGWLVARRNNLGGLSTGFLKSAAVVTGATIVVGWAGAMVLPWMVAAAGAGLVYAAGCYVSGLYASSGVGQFLKVPAA